MQILKFHTEFFLPATYKAEFCFEKTFILRNIYFEKTFIFKENKLLPGNIKINLYEVFGVTYYYITEIHTC